ncbi:hypothetical protein [Paenibacillus antibioticophila]|uniref:hypothetical protein n=1 Tax=Paenibacillus antibioticophila TaxID=1274374 RepID=UPI0005C870C6|nr:hypothetical protein [Paenibacillus antibioticophila]
MKKVVLLFSILIIYLVFLVLSFKKPVDLNSQTTTIPETTTFVSNEIDPSINTQDKSKTYYADTHCDTNKGHAKVLCVRHVELEKCGQHLDNYVLDGKIHKGSLDPERYKECVIKNISPANR